MSAPKLASNKIPPQPKQEEGAKLGFDWSRFEALSEERDTAIERANLLAVEVKNLKTARIVILALSGAVLLICLSAAIIVLLPERREMKKEMRKWNDEREKMQKAEGLLRKLNNAISAERQTLATQVPKLESLVRAAAEEHQALKRKYDDLREAMRASVLFRREIPVGVRAFQIRRVERKRNGTGFVGLYSDGCCPRCENQGLSVPEGEELSEMTLKMLSSHLAKQQMNADQPMAVVAIH